MSQRHRKMKVARGHEDIAATQMRHEISYWEGLWLSIVHCTWFDKQFYDPVVFFAVVFKFNTVISNFFHTDSNLSCIVCDSNDQPSCKLSNQLEGFLTKCKVGQHYCQTTIINMSKGNLKHFLMKSDLRSIVQVAANWLGDDFCP